MLRIGLPPSHPGEILKELYLDQLQITITDTAARLGISRKVLSELLNGDANVNAEMALRFSLAFNTTPDLWLNLQHNFDLWKARQKLGKLGIKPLFKKKPASLLSKT